MNSLKLKKVAVTALLSACCFSTAMPTLVYADSMKTVTLGADLTQDQKNLVLSYFGIKDEDKSVQLHHNQQSGRTRGFERNCSNGTDWY